MSNGQKKGSKKGLLVLPLAVVLGVVSYMQGCVGQITDAVGIFSGGGASGITSNSDGQNDNKPTDPATETQDTVTPAPTEEAQQGSEQQKNIVIVVDGRNVTVDGKAIDGYDQDNLNTLSSTLTTLLQETYQDGMEVVVSNQSGDVNVNAVVNEVLSKLAITPTEQ